MSARSEEVSVSEIPKVEEQVLDEVNEELRCWPHRTQLSEASEIASAY